MRVNKSYRTYFKHPDVGRPNTASPYRNRTLEISEPANQHLKVKPNGWAAIQIKGLPTIRLRTDERMPKGEQPKAIRITLKPRRMVVSLVYQQEPKDLGEPAKQSVGIDPGVKHNITAVSDDGTVLQLPGFDSRPHRKVKRRLLRKMQRQRDAALKDGRARFTSQQTRTGKIKRRFRWIERPSKTYLKTLAQLRRVEQKRQDSMRGYQHRFSHQLVQDHQTICIEDTQTKNLTHSAKGTPAEPGTNVSPKTGPQPFDTGARLVRACVPSWSTRPNGTEGNSSQCPLITPANVARRVATSLPATERANQSSSARTAAMKPNADVNAAENIRRQGRETPWVYRHRPPQATKRTTPPQGRDGTVHMNSLYPSSSEISYPHSQPGRPPLWRQRIVRRRHNGLRSVGVAEPSNSGNYVLAHWRVAMV